MSLKDQTTLLTTDEVAGRIKFSVHTIRKWVGRHLCEFPQPLRLGPQREWRFRESDIAAWLDRKPAPKRRRGMLKERA